MNELTQKGLQPFRGVLITDETTGNDRRMHGESDSDDGKVRALMRSPSKVFSKNGGKRKHRSICLTKHVQSNPLRFYQRSARHKTIPNFQPFFIFYLLHLFTSALNLTESLHFHFPNA